MADLGDAYSAENLGPLIAAYRCQERGSREALSAWLYGYVLRVVCGVFTTQNDSDRDDVHSEVALRLITNLPEILARVDLNQRPLQYVWTCIYSEIMNVISESHRVRTRDEEAALDFGWLYRDGDRRGPYDAITGQEDIRFFIAAVEVNCREFRFPKWSRAYTRMLLERIGTHREPACPANVPGVVYAAAIYHMRRLFDMLETMYYERRLRRCFA